MYPCFSARSGTRLTGVVRREFPVSVRYGGASNTEAGSYKLGSYKAESFHTCVKDSWNPGSRAIVEISTKRGKLDYPILYADGKAPGDFSCKAYSSLLRFCGW
jgi:hypothetical protein